MRLLCPSEFFQIQVKVCVYLSLMENVQTPLCSEIPETHRVNKKAVLVLFVVLIADQRICMFVSGTSFC